MAKDLEIRITDIDILVNLTASEALFLVGIVGRHLRNPNQELFGLSRREAEAVLAYLRDKALGIIQPDEPYTTDITSEAPAVASPN